MTKKAIFRVMSCLIIWFGSCAYAFYDSIVSMPQGGNLEPLAIFVLWFIGSFMILGRALALYDA